MSFFYDLNKKLDSIRATPEVTHKQLNERDMGKHNNATTGFAALAKKAGGGEKGEKIAGAQFQKMKKAGQLEEEGFPRIQAGIQKYTQPGIEKLAKLGREGASKAKMAATRKEFNQYDNKEVDEGVMDTVKSVGKKVASGVNRLVGHGSDEEMRKDLQRKSGAPVTGKKPSAAPKQTPIDPKDEYDYFTGRDKVRGGEQQQKTTEAAKYRDPKYKDKLYTVEPLDYTYGPDADELYYNPKPDDYEGRKRKIGGGEFSHNDPLRKGFGRGGASNSINTHGKRKGMPSRDQITSLKGSIKDASGTHAEPNLPEAGAPMTAKQKSFAKLAPPADKITFADKIAGAKKEVDEMLGDVAAEAMRSALGGGKGRNAEMDEERSKGTAFDMSTPRDAAPKAGSTERGAKHDIKHGTTDPRYKGRIATRRTDAQGNSVDADDESDAQAEPRGRGRPKGTTGAIGAKGPSGRSKLMTKEGDHEDGELKAAMALLKKAGYKVSKAESTDTRDDHAEKAGKQVAKDIEYDEKKKDNIHGKKRGPEDARAEKAGKRVAKDIEHDEKKKDKEVDESTTSGSVATSTATKSSKGSMVGKGIYDSMNRELENMIAESMTINMSDSTEGGKSLTITATDEDALKLGMLLKNAGLGGGDAHGGDMHSSGEEPCATCGMPDCGCGDVQEAVDENAPDWPTNTETSPNAMQYAGGLNKPKTDVAGDGQTTIPNTAVHTQDEDALRRMMEMAGIKQAELEPWKETMKEEELDEELEEDFLESIQRMREIAGIQEAKKAVDEEKTEEGNLFTKGLEDDDVKIGDKIPGTNAIKKKDIDESIFALNNQWQAYKG